MKTHVDQLLPGLEPGTSRFDYVKNRKVSPEFSLREVIELDTAAYRNNPTYFNGGDLRDGALDPELLYALRLASAAESLGKIGTRQALANVHIHVDEQGKLGLAGTYYSTATNGLMDKSESFIDVLKMAEPSRHNEDY